MPNTTADALRTATDEALKVVASFDGLELSDRREAWTARLAELITDAHEAAHRENERRWALAQAGALGLGTFSEDTDAIVDLAQTYRRNWRLAREVGLYSAGGSRRVSQASAAYRELMDDYGIAVEGGYDVLTLVTV